MTFKAVNWNNASDFDMLYWSQNIMQFWSDEEFVPSFDKKDWETKLTEKEREVYRKVLGGLTMLDTIQGGVGMPSLSYEIENLVHKATLSFMGAMEQMHAKSYSTIFTTLDTSEKIDEIFSWVEKNEFLQKKAEIISKNYDFAYRKPTPKELYLGLVASVLLESFLFYSGFYYPLYMAGQGKMKASGEIINLILRDESIHGLFVGLLAQNQYEKLNSKEKEEVEVEVKNLLNELMENETNYTHDVYSSLGSEFEEDVIDFIKYNANKALMNLGRESYYEHKDINPVVLNGLSTETKTHDFFSQKGNGYIKGKVVSLTDETFDFIDNMFRGE